MPNSRFSPPHPARTLRRFFQGESFGLVSVMDTQLSPEDLCNSKKQRDAIANHRKVRNALMELPHWDLRMLCEFYEWRQRFNDWKKAGLGNLKRFYENQETAQNDLRRIHDDFWAIYRRK